MEEALSAWDGSSRPDEFLRKALIVTPTPNSVTCFAACLERPMKLISAMSPSRAGACLMRTASLTIRL